MPEAEAHPMTNLPGWADMSDLDRGAALLHDRARESEGDEYAAENYPARYLRDPRLVALGPVEATAHARKVTACDSGDMFDRLGEDEYFRLYELAADHGKPPTATQPAPPVAAPAPKRDALPQDVAAAIDHAVSQGLPRPLSAGVPANGNLTLRLSTPGEVDAWAALVGATVGHDDYTYRSNPDDFGSPVVHEYGTAWEHSTYGRWLGRQVAVGCEVPGEPPRP